MAKFWASPIPVTCNICKTRLGRKFYDVKTKSGAWGFLCCSCFLFEGCKLGAGGGQEYTKQDDGRFLKTGG
jgi:hypothetical protein